MNFYTLLSAVREKRHTLQKTLLVMKLVIVIIFTAVLQAAASAGRAQSVTLKVKDAPLEVIISDLKDQTGYSFIYDPAAIAVARPVTLDVKNAQLKEVLDLCLKNQPLEYTIATNVVAIKQKQPATKETIQDIYSLLKVIGRVADEQGRPISGATVIIKGTGNATITDENGVFVLKNVDANAIIVVTYVGYEKKEINASNDVGTIHLIIAKSQLDEVQVIAYGQTSRRLSVSNISSIKAADIEKQPVSNPLLALENRVPGLFITQNNGFGNGGVTVRIQGQNSLQNGNDPLIVIDGVPYNSQITPTGVSSIIGTSGASAIGGAQPPSNPLSFIDPNEIESIDILKDADATAIYGSRAANGAILITTKKGKPGQTKVSFNLQQGVGQVSHFVPLMNRQQYLTMRHQAKKNDNAVISATDYDINGFWDTTRYTNWQKTLIGGNAQYGNYSGDVSGGTTNTQYLIGGSYHRETTVFPGDFDNKKGSLHFNINSATSDQRFKIQFSGSYQADVNHLPGQDLTASAVHLAPDAPSLYNPDGTLNWAPNQSGTSTWTNPLAYQYDKYTAKTDVLLGNLLLSYHLFPGLDLTTSFGYTTTRMNETELGPLIGYAPETRPFRQPSTIFGNGNTDSWNIEPQIHYKKAISRGILDALLGSTANQGNSVGYSFYGLGYLSDANLGDVGSAGTLLKIYSNASTYKYNALFARLNYIWDNKYILDLTGRRDGSSRFGPANEFHNFWSLGGAWVFTEEAFVKGNSLLSFGKLKGSYGTTGNDQIGDYSYLSQYLPVQGLSLPYQGGNGLLPSGISNPYLQWEETKKLQIGIELGFLKDRVIFDATYINNRSSNQLLNYSLPNITGFPGILENFPATVQNTAWEFTLNSDNIKGNSFQWSTSINFTIPRNKLLAFPGITTSSYQNSLFIGQPITIAKVYHFVGVDPSTGLYQFASSTGPTSNPNPVTDENILINLSPTLYGGLNNSFRFKGLQLDILWSFVKRYGQNFRFGTLVPGRKGYNQPTYAVGAWEMPGQTTDVQKYNSNLSLGTTFNNAANNSDAGISDASYARLKNVSLSWSIPNSWCKNANLQNCSLFVQGQNLLTITKYKGLDPETLSTTTLPTLRVITLGLKFGL